MPVAVKAACPQGVGGSGDPGLQQSTGTKGARIVAPKYDLLWASPPKSSCTRLGHWEGMAIQQVMGLRGSSNRHKTSED